MPDEPQQTQANGTRDLAGYPDEQSLVQGYRNSSAEAKRWRDEAQRWKQQAEVAAVNQRQNVPDRNRNPYERLEQEYGVPADALREAIGAEIGQALAPITRGFEARNQLLSQYKDYTKYEADVAGFVNSDPAVSQTYTRMFQADPAGAMEYAFLKFGETKRGEVTQQPQQQAERQQQAANAQIPSNRSGDGRNPQAAEQDEIARAWEHYQKTGNPMAYAKARLKRVIPDSFFQQ